jgi:hypothetical protein
VGIMEEKKTIDAKVFFKLFVAISYAREQVFFNLIDLTEYLWGKYIAENDVFNQLDEEFEDMLANGIITKVKGCNNLYQINGKIDYVNIIKEYGEYKNDMLKFFENYYDKSPKVNIEITTKSKTI